jgi:hypothetical protein
VLSAGPERVPIARENPLCRDGARFAVVVYAWLRWAVTGAALQGIHDIYYLSREGEFLAVAHEHLRAAGALPPHVRPHVLEVSRLSTFAASIRSLTVAELMRMWSLYGSQTLGVMLRSLTLDSIEYTRHLARHGLTLTERIDRPWEHPRIEALVTDQEFRALSERRFAELRRQLRAYIASRGLADSTPATAVVDVGWRGTIQDNLALAFPRISFHGYYLGLRSFLNPQPANAAKHAFVADENQPVGSLRVLDYVAPYEMVLSSGSGAVAGYVSDGERPRAVRRMDEREQVCHARHIQHFQRGVLEALPLVHARHKQRPTSQLKAESLEACYRLAFRPSRPLARAFLDLVHDETFGVGTAVNMDRPFPTALAMRALLQVDDRRQLDRWLDQTGWPSGYAVGKRRLFLLRLAVRKWELTAPLANMERLLATATARRRFRSLVRRLRGRRVCLYGAGRFAQALTARHDLRLLSVIAVIDRDERKWGTQLANVPVVAPSALSEIKPDVVVLSVLPHDGVHQSVKELVAGLQLPCEVIADAWL